MKLSKLHKNAIIIIPIIFLFFSAPSALDYVFHFPDEKYYTDAVLQMMEKDDYFTPYQADGTPRFKKPIITYWVLMGSYKLFGVSRFSSRIFFWLAGAFLVLITYLMAKSLSGNKKTATTAAFLTAANPLVLMSASRSIPDILLVLFLTISAWGFLEIMILQKPQKKHFWMAYLGTALAFETKGIPAAAFAGTSILFLLLNPWKRKTVKQLFEPVSISIAIVIALSWFIIMYMQHGSEYLSSFFADQLSGRISSKSIQVIKNTGLGIINLAAYLIPWIFIVFSNPGEVKKLFQNSPSKNKSIFGFIFTWVILIIIMSGAVFRFYDRYLLPGIPLISLLFAYIFTLSNPQLKKTFQSVFIGLNILILSINILYTIFILPDTKVIVGIIIGIILITCLYFGIFRKVPKVILISNGIMLFYFNTFLLLYPLLMPNPGEQLVQNLKSQGISKNEKVYVYGNIRTASNIRIHSNNKIQVISMDTVYSMPTDSNHFIVFSKKEEAFLELSNYKINKGSEEWLSVPVKKFPEFLQPAISNLKNSGTSYYIATPINPKP